MDTIIEGINTEPDAAKRAALVGQLQTLAQTDLPSLSLLELTFFRAVSRRLDGLDENPIGVYSSLACAYFKS
jgi:ABC-type transport system substrate-binding protein